MRGGVSGRGVLEIWKNEMGPRWVFFRIARSIDASSYSDVQEQMRQGNAGIGTAIQKLCNRTKSDDFCSRYAVTQADPWRAANLCSTHESKLAR